MRGSTREYAGRSAAGKSLYALEIAKGLAAPESELPTCSERNGGIEFRGVVAGRYRIWLASSLEDIWRLVVKEMPLE